MVSKKPTSTARKLPSRKAVRRAVASSTALETGRSIAEIERKLQRKTSRFRSLKLAGQ